MRQNQVELRGVEGTLRLDGHYLTRQERKYIHPYVTGMVSEDLELRARPTQARSVVTFELILDTTGVLLETRGFDALTTNLIAEEAGVTVRAIYRYFPNKHAIVVELARRMAFDWSESLDSLGSLADPNVPWRALWDSYIDGFVSAVRATPGGRAVLLAMRADPDLRRVDDEANDNYISGIASELASRVPNLSAAEALSVATVLVRSTVAVVDEAFDTEDSAGAKLLHVLKAMHLGLLGQYLDDPIPTHTEGGLPARKDYR